MADHEKQQWQGENPQVLLIKRGEDPYKGCWAFPGSFMNMDETMLPRLSGSHSTSCPTWPLTMMRQELEGMASKDKKDDD